MSDIRAFRETTHGDEYKFRFEEKKSGFNVYVVSHPENPRGGTEVDTHILAGNKLCLEPKPKTMEKALGGAFYWMVYFSNYIRTGVTDQPGARAHVVE